MAEIKFPVFDSDNHLCQTRDALTRFLPERSSYGLPPEEVRKMMGAHMMGPLRLGN